MSLNILGNVNEKRHFLQSITIALSLCEVFDFVPVPIRHKEVSLQSKRNITAGTKSETSHSEGNKLGSFTVLSLRGIDSQYLFDFQCLFLYFRTTQKDCVVRKYFC